VIGVPKKLEPRKVATNYVEQTARHIREIALLPLKNSFFSKNNDLL
jgi:hypothetical protein